MSEHVTVPDHQLTPFHILGVSEDRLICKMLGDLDLLKPYFWEGFCYTGSSLHYDEFEVNLHFKFKWWGEASEEQMKKFLLVIADHWCYELKYNIMISVEIISTHFGDSHGSSSVDQAS